MAGKSKQEKKKRAKTKKREKELLRQKVNHKIAADQPEDVLGNNAEKAMPEEATKPDHEPSPITEEVQEDRESKPFDPSSVVANILKKKDGA